MAGLLCTATVLKWAAVPAALLASGTVHLSDDDSSSALFSAANLKPGATGTKCIAVTSTGSGSETKVYKFTYTLSASAPDSTQGGTAAIGLTWEPRTADPDHRTRVCRLVGGKAPTTATISTTPHKNEARRRRRRCDPEGADQPPGASGATSYAFPDSLSVASSCMVRPAAAVGMHNARGQKVHSLSHTITRATGTAWAARAS